MDFHVFDELPRSVGFRLQIENKRSLKLLSML